MRKKTYAIINISGLAVGVAVFLVIFMIIQFQTSFDNFHSKKDRIYRVLTEHHNEDASTVSYSKGLPFPLPTGLKTTFPQLQQVAPIYASHNDQFQVLDDNGTPVKNFKEQNGVFYTSSAFFKMFDFPLLAGSYASLNDPNNVLLTKETAEKYFGDWKAAKIPMWKLAVSLLKPRISRAFHNSLGRFPSRRQTSSGPPLPCCRNWWQTKAMGGNGFLSS